MTRQTDAEHLLSREIEKVQLYAADVWRRHERTALVEIVRSLDVAAVARARGLTASPLIPPPPQIQFLLAGATTAMRPFLAKVHGNSDDVVPWGPSTRGQEEFADVYLRHCGRLTHLRRMAALERYGLATTTIESPNKLIIETRWGSAELAATAAMELWRARHHGAAVGNADDRTRRQWLEERMAKYVESANSWFIRYDNRSVIVKHYRQDAREYGHRFLEREALPPDAQLGGEPFEEWMTACDWALGRILCHVDYATLLRRKEPQVQWRDILTIYARREDLAEVWLEAGLAAERLPVTINAMSLEIDRLDDFERASEMPTPFYIDFGEHFVLLPCFGALLNPYFTLFRHLRHKYRPEWDRAVDGRERMFRHDVAQLLAEPRFHVPPNGFAIRRADGSKITDIDAVVLDRQTGTLALIQLKWHDIFGRSLAERDSRRRNLLGANRWVNDVCDWMGADSSSSKTISARLGMRDIGGEVPPILYVVARYVAYFTGEQTQDARASWISWPEMIQAIAQCEGETDPLRLLADKVAMSRKEFEAMEEVQQIHEFRDLTVELRVARTK